MSQISRYHPLLVALHWLLALLLIAALALGALVMRNIPNSDPMKLEALRSHMLGGTAILLLMGLRLVVRLRTPHPPAAMAGAPQLDRLAWLSHRLLYLLVFAMGASGLAMAWAADLPGVLFQGRGALPGDFWEFTARPIHYLVSRALMLLIALHVAAALYHVLVRKDGLLRRMWFARPASVDWAAWFARLALLLPGVLFTFIGTSYVTRPFAIAAGSHMSLGSPAAVTDMRAIGATFLAGAVICVIALFSPQRRLAGLGFVAILIGCVTAARLLGLALDGSDPETSFKLVPEFVLLFLSLAGFTVERLRRQPASAELSNEPAFPSASRRAS